MFAYPDLDEQPFFGASALLAARSVQAPAGDSESEDYTTVMLRNIPNKYTRQMLIDRLHQAGFHGDIDYLYLPIDFSNRCNVGYCFANLRTPAARRRFTMSFDGVAVQVCLPGFNSYKICQVTKAKWQGREENLRKLRSGPELMTQLASHPEWLPLLLDPQGQQEPFLVDELANRVASANKGRPRRACDMPFLDPPPEPQAQVEGPAMWPGMRLSTVLSSFPAPRPPAFDSSGGLTGRVPRGGRGSPQGGRQVAGGVPQRRRGGPSAYGDLSQLVGLPGVAGMPFMNIQRAAYAQFVPYQHDGYGLHGMPAVGFTDQYDGAYEAGYWWGSGSEALRDDGEPTYLLPVGFDGAGGDHAWVEGL